MKKINKNLAAIVATLVVSLVLVFTWPDCCIRGRTGSGKSWNSG